jgi:hypothetical protein
LKICNSSASVNAGPLELKLRDPSSCYRCIDINQVSYDERDSMALGK